MSEQAMQPVVGEVDEHMLQRARGALFPPHPSEGVWPVAMGWYVACAHMPRLSPGRDWHLWWNAAAQHSLRQRAATFLMAHQRVRRQQGPYGDNPVARLPRGVARMIAARVGMGERPNILRMLPQALRALEGRTMTELVAQYGCPLSDDQLRHHRCDRARPQLWPNPISIAFEAMARMDAHLWIWPAFGADSDSVSHCTYHGCLAYTSTSVTRVVQVERPAPGGGAQKVRRQEWQATNTRVEQHMADYPPMACMHHWPPQTDRKLMVGAVSMAPMNSKRIKWVQTMQLPTCDHCVCVFAGLVTNADARAIKAGEDGIDAAFSPAAAKRAKDEGRTLSLHFYRPYNHLRSIKTTLLSASSLTAYRRAQAAMAQYTMVKAKPSMSADNTVDRSDKVGMARTERRLKEWEKARKAMVGAVRSEQRLSCTTAAEEYEAALARRVVAQIYHMPHPVPHGDAPAPVQCLFDQREMAYDEYQRKRARAFVRATQRIREWLEGNPMPQWPRLHPDDASARAPPAGGDEHRSRKRPRNGRNIDPSLYLRDAQ